MKLIVDRLTVNVREEVASTPLKPMAERRYQVSIDGKPRGSLTLLPYYLPAIAVHTSFLILWGGTKLYILRIEAGVLRLIEQEEEVVAVYKLEYGWVVVREVSVVVYDLMFESIRSTFSHDEVFIESLLSGDDLVVEDFQKRRLQFQLMKDGSILQVPASH